MPLPSRLMRFFLLLGMGCVLAACGSVKQGTQALSKAIQPYKPPVIQGNFVSKEQLELLKPGLVRAQVKDLLGTPLVTSLFHADRWDYVFTLQRQGVAPQARHLSLFFKGEVLERIESGELPSETEFVSQIDSRRELGKAPPLQATEDALNAFTSKSPKSSTPSSPPPPTGEADSTPRVYPPLEP